MRFPLDPFAIPRYAVLISIRLYQKTLSPDHGLISRIFPFGYCKYHPTCSEYTYQAVERFGIIRGLLLGTGRVFRCNPWSRGGFDPVPKKKKSA